MKLFLDFELCVECNSFIDALTDEKSILSDDDDTRLSLIHIKSIQSFHFLSTN